MYHDGPLALLVEVDERLYYLHSMAMLDWEEDAQLKWFDEWWVVEVAPPLHQILMQDGEVRVSLRELLLTGCSGHPTPSYLVSGIHGEALSLVREVDTEKSWRPPRGSVIPLHW